MGNRPWLAFDPWQISSGVAMVFLAAMALTVSLGVDGRTNANVAMASEGTFVTVVWSAAAASGSTDIYAGISTDHGASFSSPVRVNSAPGGARAHGEQPPRVVLIPRGGTTPSIVVVWGSKSRPARRC